LPHLFNSTTVEEDDHFSNLQQLQQLNFHQIDQILVFFSKLVHFTEKKKSFDITNFDRIFLYSIEVKA